MWFLQTVPFIFISESPQLQALPIQDGGLEWLVCQSLDPEQGWKSSLGSNSSHPQTIPGCFVIYYWLVSAQFISHSVWLERKTLTIDGGLHAWGDVTATDQLGDHSVELAQLSILVLNGRAGTLVQSDQHESGRDIQLQQLGLFCQACVW